MEGRSSSGCVMKGLIALGISAIVLVLGGIFTVYYIVYHTAIPARGIVSFINKSPDIQIEGVTGSISSGFAVETIRLKDDSGNTNALDDVRLFYEKDGETFIITELHIGRGHFYYDRGTGKLSTDYSDDITSVPASPEPPPGSSPLNLIIRKASINNITIEDVASGETFVLEKAELQDLEMGKPTKLGSLIVASATCNMQILPMEGKQNSYTIEGTLKPGLHESIIAPISIQGTADSADDEKVDLNISAFDGALNVKGTHGDQTIVFKNFTLATYFRDAPPLSRINLVITAAKEKGGNAKGSFLIGQKTFSIDQALDGARTGHEVIIATHSSGGITYTIESKTESNSESVYPSLKLRTQPEMPHDDAVGMLMLDKKAASLSTAEKLMVEKALKHIIAPTTDTPKSGK